MERAEDEGLERSARAGGDQSLGVGGRGNSRGGRRGSRGGRVRLLLLGKALHPQELQLVAYLARHGFNDLGDGVVPTAVEVRRDSEVHNAVLSALLGRTMTYIMTTGEYQHYSTRT